MFHKSSKQILLSIFVALLLMATPGYAVEIFKTSNYGGGHQIWFEVEDFDEREPDDDSRFALSDEAGAFGRSINSLDTGGDASGYVRYTFDISKAGGRGGTWYFWGRVINPSNQSDFMLVDGHPGDQTPVTSLPVSGLVNGQRIFEQNEGPPWAWTNPNHEEAHTKTLQDGENTMWILNRQAGAIWDVFMWTDDPDYVPTDNDYINAAVFVGGSASDPSPADGAIDVPREVVLSWKAGEFAPATDGHKVYFSTSFNDVNDRVGAMTQSVASYAPPQRLDLGTTYYWRVDEVNGPPDFTVYEGDVWSFTTELLAYPIENIIVTASSSSADKGAENTVNGSGLDDSGLLHSNVGDNNMWLSETGGPQPTWIEFEFDNVYKLHEMWVWNSNETMEPVIGFGFKDVTIEYSSNGVDYMTLGTTHEFARGIGAAGYAHNTTVDTGGVPAKYVKLTANSNWGGILPQFGLSEVRFFYIPVLAREPNPESGAKDVSVGTIDAPADVTLSFRPGREAAKHDVYFSSDFQAVTDGTAPVTTVTEASHGPLSLDLATTYYWRVDEVNEVESPTTWQGVVWDFTTQKYFVVDDFESYNDLDPDDPESKRIFNVWLDGYGVATNGSVVGYEVPSFVEKTIVRSGGQSMPLAYDNSGTAQYSEATLTLSPQQDWTIKSLEALSLWFKGNPAGFVEDPVGTYTMTAQGYDIWQTRDEFRYAYKQLSGDGEMTATVVSVDAPDGWTKAGVMIRQTLEEGSANAFIAITGGSGDGATFQWRQSAGGSSSSSRTLTGISPPSSIKLVRAGNTFTGYVFQDGQWKQEGDSTTVAMVDPVYIGLALTSHLSGATATAVFTDVQSTGAITGVFTDQAIGVDMPANTADPIYVAVASGGAPVVVQHDDPGATQAGVWTEWSIDLKQLSDAGVNLTGVSSISIGVGDKANPQPGGSGLLFVDDIRLYPHREPPDETQLEAEAADVMGASWRIYDDAASSGGKHIGSEDGDGDDNDTAPGAEWLAAYNFTAAGGTYKVSLLAQERGSDSFWVRIVGARDQTHEDPDQPGTGWVRFNGIDAPDTWTWDDVHSNDHDNTVVNWTLPPGPLTLEIAKREDGVLLDAILITDAVD
ncbi:MAG: hypothetical protein ACYS9C_01125 [Planctomycetota bacterium]